MIYVFKEVFTGKIRRVSGDMLAGMMRRERILGLIPRYTLNRVVLPGESISIAGKDHIKIKKAFGLF